MKTFRLLIVFALVLIAFSSAQGASAALFVYTSGFQVQNLEATQATITVTFYNQDGTVDTTVNDTVPANGSKTYFPVQASSGFNGSVVISSDKAVAAIGNVLTDNYNAGASYSAASAGDTEVSLPLLMQNNNGLYTWFNVQNTGSSDANVSVAYSDGSTASHTIKPGAAYTFDQSAETHTAKVFSGIITSNVPVAATVIQELGTPPLMFAYSGFAKKDGTDLPVMPLVNVQPGKAIQTGIQIQNSGASPTDVTVSYTPSGAAGTACTETQTIPATSSKTFALGAFAGSPPAGATTTCVSGDFIGSAAVTTNSANMPLAAIVNQLAPTNGEAYNGFKVGNATSKVVMPLIMDRNNGLFTGFSIMNVGTASTTVNCTFTNNAYTVGKTLAPGEALADLQENKLGEKYVGAGTCTASESSAQIVGVVNQVAASSIDQLFVYEGVNTP